MNDCPWKRSVIISDFHDMMCIMTRVHQRFRGGNWGKEADQPDELHGNHPIKVSTPFSMRSGMSYTAIGCCRQQF